MRLTWRLFLSYTMVIGIALFTVSVAMAYLAPQNFTRVIRQEVQPQLAHQMNEAQRNRMMYQWQGESHQNMMPHDNIPPSNPVLPVTASTPTIETELAIADADFEQKSRQAVISALLIAGMAAMVSAGGTSWYVSQRIVRPIRAMVKASEYIAEGNYEQRLMWKSEDELGELAASFNQMAESLARTENLRRQLMADVSHELKTPLACIKGYMEGLQDGIIPSTPETFQLIHEETDRLQRLVHDLQEISRTEAMVALELKTCNPTVLIDKVVSKLQPQFDDKNVKLVIDLVTHLPSIQADPDRIQQVLTNLLGNALQYTESGGTVQVTAQPTQDQVVFAIKDDGIGLAQEDLQLVFQRFYRVDKSRARVGGGSGIGLTIAKHWVTLQRGRIWAESSGLGQGSVFYFTLPCS